MSEAGKLSSKFHVRWVDRRLEPKNPANPRFPNGVDIDSGARPACRVTLPYPAKRIGFYLIDCEICGTNAVITTAGRKDDPRSVMLPCKKGLH